MKLRTKNKLFNDMSIASLFTLNRTYTVKELQALDSVRYDMGKYNPDCRLKTDIKRTNIPIWYELRNDRDGKYLCLKTFNGNSPILNELWDSI